MRRELERLEVERRSIVSSLYANGNMTEQGMQSATDSIDEKMRETREAILAIARGDVAVDTMEDQLDDEKWW